MKKKKKKKKRRNKRKEECFTRRIRYRFSVGEVTLAWMRAVDEIGPGGDFHSWDLIKELEKMRAHGYKKKNKLPEMR